MQYEDIPENGKFSNYEWNNFVSQDFLVKIVPKFTMDAVKSITSDDTVYGPFRPNYEIEVPLWLALFFRQTSTCTIIPPYFLNINFLNETLEKERESDTDYQPLPYHFFELSFQIIAAAKQDVPYNTEVIRLIKEIRATRHQKLSKTVSSFNSVPTLNMPALRLTNLLSFEIEYLRTTIAPVFEYVESLELCSQQSAPVDVLTPVISSTQRAVASNVGNNVNTPLQYNANRSNISHADSDIRTTVTRSSGGFTPVGVNNSIARTSVTRSDDTDRNSAFAPGLTGQPRQHHPSELRGNSQETSINNSSIAQALFQTQTQDGNGHFTQHSSQNTIDTTISAVTTTSAAPAPKKRRTLRQQ